MKNSVYEHTNYKTYLRIVIAERAKGGYGERSRLARILNCQSAYISQVLNGDSHFNLEQADVINGYCGHTKEEARFFFLLVGLARSGTTSLREKFKEQIDEVLESRLILKNRISVKTTLRPDGQATYYSHWTYSAVHMLLTIPEFRTKETIATRLNISVERTSEILDFLVQSGLAVSEKGKFHSGEVRLHIPSDSPFVVNHHTNLRLRAIQQLEGGTKEIHYSSIVTLSKGDLRKIKDLLIGIIQNVKAIVKDSNEEELCAFNLDFFRLN